MPYDHAAEPGPQALGWDPVGELSDDAIAVFHACIARDVFAGLERQSVCIAYKFIRGDSSHSAAARPLLVRLFAPWLTGGVVSITLPDHSRIDAIPGAPGLEYV